MCYMTRFHCKFPAESNGERILKIGQHLLKLWTNNIIGLFMTHSVWCIYWTYNVMLVAELLTFVHCNVIDMYMVVKLSDWAHRVTWVALSEHTSDVSWWKWSLLSVTVIHIHIHAIFVNSCVNNVDIVNCFWLLCLRKMLYWKNTMITYTFSGKKRCHFIFNYNSCNSWSIFIIFAPVDTRMNTPQGFVITYLP